MKYYAPIAFPSHSYYFLQQNAVKYLDRLNLIHSKPETASVPLNLQDTLENIPEITTLLDTVNLTPAKIFMFKAGSTFESHFLGTITAGYSANYSTIEIPVIGCNFSRIEFYAARPKELRKHDGQFHYVTVDESTAQLVDSVTITEPTIIQHRAPQKIVMERQFVTRISLRIITTTDPTSLL